MLTSVIAGHAQATTTYFFYEELDRWLGPWGTSGYPIGYGKFYNIAFSTNAKLMANPSTKEWVWKTTVLLQEALRDYVVAKIKDCTLPGLTEAELRKAAFDSHPACYDQGGLALLALTAPELIPVIATIPGREFDPRSANFGPTVEQVFITIARIAPQVVGNSLAALAGPAHTGIFRRAIQMDQQRFMDEMSMSQELGSIQRAIERGDLDHVPLLNEVIRQLNSKQYPNQGFAQAAGQVVTAAERRRSLVQSRLNSMLEQSPPVRDRVHGPRK